jgi:hypothetical protein
LRRALFIDNGHYDDGRNGDERFCHFFDEIGKPYLLSEGATFGANFTVAGGR